MSCRIFSVHLHEHVLAHPALGADPASGMSSNAVPGAEYETVVTYRYKMTYADGTSKTGDLAAKTVLSVRVPDPET